jgi:uncharacterized protein
MKRNILVLLLLVGLLIPGISLANTIDEGVGMKEMLLKGIVGQRADANLDQWMLTAPYVNPAMFEMFRQRDKLPQQAIMAWYGEFPGKYLTSAVYLYRMNHDQRLYQVIRYTVEQLAALQDADGYLGVFAKDNRLIGYVSEKVAAKGVHWDCWNHYHCMLGLLLWYQTTGDEQALQVCLKAADYVYGFFIGGGHTLDECGSGETNMAIGHVFALLYEQTHDPRYMETVNATLEAFTTPAGGDYLSAGLQNVSFYKTNKPRWESLHCIQMLYELYKITGEEQYRTAFENLWRSMLVFDRHNTGGFTSGEQAVGNPYDLRAIETCCTVSWIVLSNDMLKLTGDSYVADELELSTYNALLGAQHPSGRSFTYNTPMIGDKKASSHDIVFQAHAGSYELNCCSVNGPRGIGMIGDWGVAVSEDSVTINYYGASRTKLTLCDGSQITLVQETDYPLADTIRIRIESEKPVTTKLRLRIPFWSEINSLTYNGKQMPAPTVRSYYGLKDTFAPGSEIVLKLDLRLHYWAGNYELGGKSSIYRGPILLAYDQRFNDASYLAPEELDLKRMDYTVLENTDSLWPSPWLKLSFTDITGQPMIICDFASAGATGTSYTTWIPMRNSFEPVPFQYANPAWGKR